MVSCSACKTIQVCRYFMTSVFVVVVVVVVVVVQCCFTHLQLLSFKGFFKGLIIRGKL